MPGDVVKEICSALKEFGAPARYDDRHDSCKVKDLSITTDGDVLILKNSKDTLFVVPSPGVVTTGTDLARGEDVVHVASSVGDLVISVPAVGRKYVRVALEIDLDKDHDVDGGAFRTFY